MADRRVAIRLGTEGKATVVTDLADIGVAGDAAFNRVARSAAKAGKDAEDAIAIAKRQADKLAMMMPGLNPTKLNANVGVRDDVGKSAQASAAVFSGAYAQMEQRAEALRRAIDPAYAAQQRFNSQMAEARSLVSAGVLSLDDYVGVLRTNRMALANVTDQHIAGASASGSYRVGMQQLSYQISDVGTQLASGTSIFQIFGQQASQFIQALSLMSEGSGGAAGGVEKLTTATTTNVGATSASTRTTLQNVAGREALVGASASSTKAVNTNTLALGGNAAATEGAAVATTGLAAAKARLIAFMAGPWGAVIVGGVSMLGLMASKYIGASDASKEATKALEEQRKAVLALADAQTKAITTAERKQALDVAEIKISLDAAMATRMRTQALLEEAREKAQSAQRRIEEGGGDEALGAAVRYDAQVNRLEGQMRANAEEIAKLQRGVDDGYARMIQQRTLARTTPEGTINSRYDRQAADAMTTLGGIANGSRLSARLAEIEAARDRELKSIEKSTVARDQETVTASSVAKMLRSALPGVQVTSTTGGKHVANSYHYRPGGQAVDFVPAGGMSSMTKADVRKLFESRGIEIVELLGPGDKGHSDHFHVAWTKGKLALDGFSDAAKRANEAERELAEANRVLDGDLSDIVGRFDPARVAAEAYADTLAKIARLQAAGRLSPSDGLKYTLEAAMAEDKRRTEEAAARFKLIMGDGGDGIDFAKDIEDRNAARQQVLLADIDARHDRERQGIQNLGNFYRDVMTGGVASIWDRFKQRGIDIIAELAAKWTMSQITASSGSGGFLGKLGALFGLVKPGAANGIAPGDGAIMNPEWFKTMPRIPGFASGTEYFSGGTALVGEEGPELVSMPRGSRVTTAGETRRMMAGANDNGSGASFHFDLRGAVMTQDLLGQMNAIGEAASARGAMGGASMAASLQMKRGRRRITR